MCRNDFEFNIFIMWAKIINYINNSEEPKAFFI